MKKRPIVRSKPSLVCVFTPSEDIPDTWVGHCLTTDIVSQGKGIQQSVKALGEAIQMCMDDDEKKGLDFYDRKPAPAEYWEQLQIEQKLTELEEYIKNFDITAPVSTEMEKLAGEVIRKCAEQNDESIESWANRLADQFCDDASEIGFGIGKELDSTGELEIKLCINGIEKSCCVSKEFWEACNEHAMELFKK